MVRSNADPSVDMYNVDNPVTLVGYLGREQYGDWPILYGPDYVDKVDNIEGSDQYVKGPTGYDLAGKNYKRDWSSAPSSHLFPRMWDGENDRGQMDSYKAFAGVEIILSTLPIINLALCTCVISYGTLRVSKTTCKDLEMYVMVISTRVSP
jgi:hypothetical protein